MTQGSLRERLETLIAEVGRKHYARSIACKMELLNEINQATSSLPTTVDIAERVYRILHGEPPHCPHGNDLKFASPTVRNYAADAPSQFYIAPVGARSALYATIP